MMISISTKKYLEKYPNTPRHMINLPFVKPWIIASGMLLADKLLGWPSYEGGYIHWTLMDIREYPANFTGWHQLAKNGKPFRLYLQDYDDWNAERLFETKEEVLTLVEELSKVPLTEKILTDFKIFTA